MKRHEVVEPRRHSAGYVPSDPRDFTRPAGTHTVDMPRISRDWLAGGILLIVGSFFLAIEFLPEAAFLIPLLVGLALLGIFLIFRMPSLLSAGGVITGVGVGILAARQGSPDFGGAGVLVSVGGGFLVVSILAAIFQVPSARAWPIAPGLVLITIGAVIYAAGLGQEVLEVATRWWPAVLVFVGAYLLLAARLRLPLYADHEAREAREARGRMPTEETGQRSAREETQPDTSSVERNEHREPPGRSEGQT